MDDCEQISCEPMSDSPQWREWAKEEIANHRRVISGSVVGERFQHRGWPPEVVLAFLAASVIRPEKGEIWQRLYGGMDHARMR